MSESLLLLPLEVDPARLVRPAAPDLFALSGAAMGTAWSLQIGGPADPHAALTLVQGALDEVVGEMSQWEPGSELSRFNRAEPGSWHKLSPGFAHVLRVGLALAAKTDGAFDPALGAVVDLWGFGPPVADRIPPAPEALAEARERSGWRRLEFDAEGRRARQPGGLQLDFSGIAKGHGVDRAVRALERAGHSCFLLEVGGELAARGLRPDGYPWWVDIETPPEADLAEIRIGLTGMAAATSGDYRRFVEAEGTRFAHTLDPRSGAPLAGAVPSVTVLHPECMIADALATAITVLGPDRGIALAEEAQVAAILLLEDRGGWSRRLSSRAQAMAEA
ncbi:MAG: FAD:protein FMN transferase [Candidatus Andeanibacterium colombiense]|uniref:FAD:protein FMN transferase n=1 Tax=Candidatus Andeanibacterium colombiense TaxID=3121345 RepID=A0AAJ5X5X9_9SPHN|nr:MAG: FAD:protein FMN transferase [Sphingomonadaceae bacterium]